MLVVGTADGVYRVTGIEDGETLAVQRILDAPRAERVRQFEAVDGLFAGTAAGLFYSTDGTDWIDLQVPREPVWAMVVSPTGDRLYAGTVPAHVYVTALPVKEEISPDTLDWRDLEGFQALPGRADWGVPRHNDNARVRDLCIHPDSPQRIVAGVEPAGVHVSEDGGVTWAARDDGVHEDIHSLHVLGDGEYLAATGRGLYRTDDAGRSWTRMDEAVTQRYVRTVFEYEGDIYASLACIPPSNRWETPEADPALFRWRDGRTLERVDAPHSDAVVVGWTATDDSLIGATHRGTLIRMQNGTWETLGALPHEETIPGCYYNLTWVPDSDI